MDYEVKIKLTVACANDSAAKSAIDTLKKFLSGSLVRSVLIGYGVTPVGDPTITIEKKK